MIFRGDISVEDVFRDLLGVDCVHERIQTLDYTSNSDVVGICEHCGELVLRSDLDEIKRFCSAFASGVYSCEDTFVPKLIKKILDYNAKLFFDTPISVGMRQSFTLCVQFIHPSTKKEVTIRTPQKFGFVKGLCWLLYCLKDDPSLV